MDWALIVATYNREHILGRCLRLAAEQTRPPAEIVVVDASATWQKTREEILANLAKDHPHIRWQYVQAEMRALPAQRNQGLKLVTSEVVFLFDDDSLMYPDCAEEIMKVYEADTKGRVAGVMAAHEPVPPDRPDDPEAARPSEHAATQNYGSLARMIRRVLDADNIFVPYDEDFPKHEMPEEVHWLEVGLVRLMPGWGMTFRRATCLQEPFSEMLRRYAALEDTDMTYRASRHGPLLVAGNARLCHIGSVGGRLNLFLLAALRNLNQVALHRLHSTDISRSRLKLHRMMARRFLILLAKDVYRRKWSFPNARGILFAFRWMDPVLNMSEAELRDWYPLFQQKAFERYGR
jgi:glycosyltransferase involved in cell wall biosynthesis